MLEESRELNQQQTNKKKKKKNEKEVCNAGSVSKRVYVPDWRERRIDMFKENRIYFDFDNIPTKRFSREEE
jgi:hypothetical protein